MSKSPLGSPLALIGTGLLLFAALPIVQACSDNTPATANTGGAPSGGAPTGGASGTPATGGSSTGGAPSGGTGTGGSAGSSSGSGAGGGGAGGATAGGAAGAAGLAGAGGNAGAAGMAGAGMAGIAGMGGAGGNGGGSGGAGAGGAGGGMGGKAGGGGAGGMISVGGSGAYVRTGWTAVYTCTGGACPPQGAADMDDVPTNAFNGNYTNRWSTGVFQSALATQNRFPLYFTVDMKQVTNVSRITTHPGCQDIFDSPGTVEVFLSIDGQNFGTAVTTMPHTPAVPQNGEQCPPNASAVATDSITIPTTPARYIQLKATRRTTSDRYWAIGELYVYP